MNLLLAHESELVPGSDAGPSERQIVVEGARARHLGQVLRADIGQRIRVGISRTSVGTAEVVELSDSRVVLSSLEMHEIAAPPRTRLILALPRPKALRRLLQTAASFGVDHIDLVNAWRVEKSYWSSPLVEIAAMEKELWLGCEQGRHAWVPTIASHRFLVPYLASLDSESPETRLLAHPGKAPWLRASDANASSLRLAIGPEGGWIESEVASFADAGFQHFVLSESILRSEIAVAAALAQVERLAAGE